MSTEITNDPDKRHFAFAINLAVRNEWDNIDLLRSSVQNCFLAVFADVDGCNAVAMVTGELLENAIKYGDWSQPSSPQQFRLDVKGDAEKSVVTVSSPTAPEGKHLDNLMQILKWIDEQESPAAAYQAKLLAIAAGEIEADSGLGLVRMAYEGNCTFSAAVEDGCLTVAAEIKL